MMSVGPWGPCSRREEAHYKRLAAEDRRKAERRKRMEARLPFRMETLARVKAGEITLAEAQKIIADHERTANSEHKTD